MNILILGPQGSGKGTQASLIAKDFNFYYFDCGSYLRELAKQNLELDEVINKRGAFVDDQQMFEIVSTHLSQKQVFDNVVFDGYPRSVIQFELLSTWLSERKKEVNLAIFIYISEEESTKRLSARRIDPKTGVIYNLITNPPPSTIDPSSLLIREDDSEKVIKERLKLYHKTTSPLVQRLRSLGILFEVDGQQPIDTIHSKILEKVRSVTHE